MVRELETMAVFGKYNNSAEGKKIRKDNINLSLNKATFKGKKLFQSNP